MQHIPIRIQVFKRQETYEGRKKMLCGMWMLTSKNQQKEMIFAFLAMNGFHLFETKPALQIMN